MRIVNVSPANAKQEAEKVEKSDNHIPTFFLFAKNEADQGKVKKQCQPFLKELGNAALWLILVLYLSRMLCLLSSLK
jgi:hypothetical protein